MTNNTNNNPSNNNNYRAIASVTAGLGAGIIAGVTTDRIINRKQQNNQTPGTAEHYTTKTTGVVSRFIVGAERTVDRTALPQEALLHLKRRSTQTSKSVDASSVYPASRETQTTYEEEAKVHLPLSTSGLVVGAILGVAVGLGTNYFLKEDGSGNRGGEGGSGSDVKPQAMPAISQVSEHDNQVFSEFRMPDSGRMSPVSKMYYDHLKHEHDTTTDKVKLLKIKYKLHDMAKKQG